MLSAEATSRSTAADHSPASYDPLRWIIPLALLHGLIYLVIAPPWQHYDEPSHFEYAWLIANHHHIPAYNEVDVGLRQIVAESMYRFRFYKPGEQPDMAAPDGPLLGANQRAHPPLYYALAALPLRATASLSVEQQLYAVRALGLGLYVLAIMTAWRVATVIVPTEPIVQLAMPLLLLLTPTFVDLMTSVNSDVLTNFAAIAMLLGCVLLIRDGPQLTPLVLATLALGVGLSTKRTAVVMIVPYALALFWAWRRTPLRLWIVIGSLFVGGLVLALTSLKVGQADNGALLLTARPWLTYIDRVYLRLNLDGWIRSATNTSWARDVYWRLLIIGFTTFWARFGWGHVQIGPWADWAIAVICLLCGAGLLLQSRRIYAQLPVWQRRCLWLFLAALMLGCLSLVVRLHPLSPYDNPYIPSGRYIFTSMLPAIWLLALGWQGVLPARWQPYGLFVLLGLWLMLDLLAWGGALVGFYYTLL